MRKFDADFFQDFWNQSCHTPCEALTEWEKRSGNKTSVKTEENGSIDPSWVVYFKDGSVAYIGNPYEEVYDGTVTVQPFDVEEIDLKKARRQVEDLIRKSSGALIESLQFLYRTGRWEPKDHGKTCPQCGGDYTLSSSKCIYCGADLIDADLA